MQCVTIILTQKYKGYVGEPLLAVIGKKKLYNNSSKIMVVIKLFTEILIYGAPLNHKDQESKAKNSISLSGHNEK